MFQRLTWAQPKVEDIEWALEAILAWPKALFYHTPLVFRHLRQLSNMGAELKPQMDQLGEFIGQLRDKLFKGRQYLPFWKAFFDKLTPHLVNLDEKKWTAAIEKRKVQSAWLFSYMKKIFEASEEASASSETEKTTVKEGLITLELINALIEDISSREGLNDSGTATRSSDEIIASILAVIGQAEELKTPIEASRDSRSPESDKSPGSTLTSPFSLDPRRLDFTDEILPVDSKAAGPDKEVSSKSFSRRMVGTKSKGPSSSVSKGTGDEFSTQTGLCAFTLESMITFVFYDLIWGTFRFFLYDLPRLIQTVEEFLSTLTFSFAGGGKTLEELNELLEAFVELIGALEPLEPCFRAIGKEIENVDITSVSQQLADLGALTDKLEVFCKKNNPALMRLLAKSLLTTVSKVQNLFAHFVDTFKGRGVLAVITPNPAAGLARGTLAAANGVASGATAMGRGIARVLKASLLKTGGGGAAAAPTSTSRVPSEGGEGTGSPSA